MNVAHDEKGRFTKKNQGVTSTSEYGMKDKRVSSYGVNPTQKKVESLDEKIKHLEEEYKKAPTLEMKAKIKRLLEQYKNENNIIADDTPFMRAFADTLRKDKLL